VLENAIEAGSPARSVAVLHRLLTEVQDGMLALTGVRTVDAYLSNIQPIEDWLAR